MTALQDAPKHSGFDTIALLPPASPPQGSPFGSLAKHTTRTETEPSLATPPRPPRMGSEAMPPDADVSSSSAIVVHSEPMGSKAMPSDADGSPSSASVAKPMARSRAMLDAIISREEEKKAEKKEEERLKREEEKRLKHEAAKEAKGKSAEGEAVVKHGVPKFRCTTKTTLAETEAVVKHVVPPPVDACSAVSKKRKGPAFPRWEHASKGKRLRLRTGVPGEETSIAYGDGCAHVTKEEAMEAARKWVTEMKLKIAGL